MKIMMRIKKDIKIFLNELKKGCESCRNGLRISSMGARMLHQIMENQELNQRQILHIQLGSTKETRSPQNYAGHTGMSSAEAKINSYTEFKNELLPRIRELGYNALQTMEVQEHAYYGSLDVTLLTSLH